MREGTFIIAEVGQAHEGSLGLLHAYIDAIAATGVDAIKFQTHIAEAESSALEPFRIAFSKQDKTRYDYWQRMSFSLPQWMEIKQHCDELGVEFMSTPFSIEAVGWLEELGVCRYKIGSGDTHNFLLIDTILATGKPVIISTGMSSYRDIDELMAHCSDMTCVGVHDNEAKNRIILMQCTTQYPTSLNAVGLNNLQEYRQRYGVPVGLSDHSGTIYPGIAASLLGASIVEVHAVFDKRMFGPDVSSSLTIEALAQLVEGIRATHTMLSNPVDKNDNAHFSSLKNTFGRSLAINKTVVAGHCISHDDLECKKPAGQGIDAKYYAQCIGKTLNKSLSKAAFLTEQDFNTDA